MTAFAYDAEDGRPARGADVSTLPELLRRAQHGGGGGVHPSGKYLYVSNRGHNSVVLFAHRRRTRGR